MNSTCNAILISKVDYGDNDMIITCLTEALGLKTFFYKGAKIKKNKLGLTPLRLVEISYFEFQSNSLANIRRIQSSIHLNKLYSNPIKITVLFFLADYIHQIIGKIHHSEKHLYEDLKNELIWLNSTDEVTNYPIFWLIFWIKKLGLKPHTSSGSYFDIETARFLDIMPNNTTFYHGIEMEKLGELFEESRLEILSIELKKQERKKMMEALISYSKYHIPEFRDLKSLEVLQTVLS